MNSCDFENFDPLNDDFVRDPYPFLAAARAQHPVRFIPSAGLWLVSRYDDIKTVLGDPQTYLSANAQKPLQAVCPAAAQVLQQRGFGAEPSLTSLDPPRHTQLREMFRSVISFPPNRIQELHDWIEACADELIGKFIDQRRTDLVGSLLEPLPARVIFHLLGFPEQDTPRLLNWCSDRLQLTWGRLSPDRQVKVAENLCEYWQYTHAFVQGRREEPRDDYTSRLLKLHLDNPDVVSLNAVTSFVYGLTFAGQETTNHLMGSLLRALLENRTQWLALVADRTLISNAVEEGLRFEPSIAAWRRSTRTKTELGGVSLPAGAQLLLHLGSAGHDAAVFRDGDKFDIHRSNSRRHLAFGFGAHFCLGAPLARLEAAVVIELLSGRIPDLELEPAQDFAYVPNLSFRGPGSLKVRWGAAGNAATG